MDPKQKAQSALEYVLSDVLVERLVRRPTQGPYRAAFEAAGVTNIIEFSIIEDSDWKDLEFTLRQIKSEPSKILGSPPKASFEETTRRFSLVERRRLTQLRSWHLDFGLQNPDVAPVNTWFHLNRGSFLEWM